MNAGRSLRCVAACLLCWRHLSVTVVLVTFAFMHVATAIAGEEEVRVGVSGRFSAYWPIYILSEQLAARKDPLRVRLIEFRSLEEVEQALTKQIIHVWAPAPTEFVLQAWRYGAPIVIGAALTRRAPYYLVTGAEVDDPKKLRGHTIGFSPSAYAQEIGHLETLEQYGLKIFRDYEIEPVFGSALKVIAIESQKIEAAFVINDLVYNLDDRSFNHFGSNKNFLEFPFLVAAFNRDWAINDSGEETDQARRFIDALGDAMFVLSDPKQRQYAIKTLMARTGFTERHVNAAYEDLIEAGDTFVTDLRVDYEAMDRLVTMSLGPEDQKRASAWRDILLDPNGLTDKK